MHGTVTQASLTIVNPVAEAQTDVDPTTRFKPAPRPATLDGKTVALYWNGKQNGLDALAQAKLRLSERFRDVRFIELTGEMGGVLRYMSPEQLDHVAAEADAAVCTTADCGSCTSWLMRDLCELEKRGVPAVGFTAVIFDEDSRFSCKTFGVPEAVPLIVPHCFSNKSTAEIGEMVDGVFDRLVDALTVDRTIMEAPPQFDSLVLDNAPELVFHGEDLMDAFETMQRRFVRNGWSDGLPLMPPTHAKVEAMIAASGRDGSEVVGLFAPGFGVGTVRKIAANAVMAGCRPEMMPVIMATVDCVLDPSLGLRTWAMSTGPQAPLICVSGPIADEIGMNRGICALGPGSISEVNVVIGRALRLIVMNVGLSYPGISDMDTIGSSMKFSACVAENEDRTPWASWREQMGFSKDESTVTVNVPYGMTEFFDFKNTTCEGLVDTLATLTANTCGSPSMGEWLIKKDAPLSAGYPFHGKVSNLMLLAPDHADVFARGGWGPQDIAEAIHRRTKLSFADLMLNQEYDSFRTSHPELAWLEDAPETLVNVMPGVDSWEFFVVGASAGRSQYCFGGTHSVTKPVKAAG
ncbi:UGSC family (seleno)protein [Flavisphingomonas formosensis]|uniref:UGSC family (seleno)protein n=1 Tax=Flavisphingomonas formosensis TaxID=861534 RepID=UPI0012F7CC42|nr:hypothetical protein [Sphingomonas formosensis]